jgi:hypothetical protein
VLGLSGWDAAKPPMWSKGYRRFTDLRSAALHADVRGPSAVGKTIADISIVTITT